MRILCTLLMVVLFLGVDVSGGVGSRYALRSMSPEEMRATVGGCPECCHLDSCERSPNPSCQDQKAVCFPVLSPCVGYYQAAPYLTTWCRYQAGNYSCSNGFWVGCGKNEPCNCLPDFECHPTWIGSWWSAQHYECLYDSDPCP